MPLYQTGKGTPFKPSKAVNLLRGLAAFSQAQRQRQQEGMATQLGQARIYDYLAKAQEATAKAQLQPLLGSFMQRALSGEAGGDYYPEVTSGGEITLKRKPRLPAESVQRISTLRELRQTAIDARQLYQAKYTGPIAEKLGKIREITGFAAPEEVAFRMKIKSLIRRAYAESGKQISEREMQQLMQFTPRLGLPEKSFNASLDTFEKELTRRIGMELETAGQAGYAVGELKKAAKQKAAKSTGLAQPKTEKDYNALPSGSRYLDPDGSIRIKK